MNRVTEQLRYKKLTWPELEDAVDQNL